MSSQIPTWRSTVPSFPSNGISIWRRPTVQKWMTKSTKRCLRKIIGQSHLTQGELLTAVVQMEAIINAHILFYISTEDVEEPLTPSHLLRGYRLLSLPECFTYNRLLDDEDIEIAPAQVAKRVKQLRENHWYSRGGELVSVLNRLHARFLGVN